MGNPTNLFFIREAVLLSRPAKLDYWPTSTFNFSTIEEFANESANKIRSLQPAAEKELAPLFADFDTFYDLQEFFDDVFPGVKNYRKFEDLDRYGAAWVQNFEKGNIFWRFEDHKSAFSPGIQKRINSFNSLAAISLPPQHYSPIQCLVHIRKMYGMELFEWKEMDALVNGVDVLIKEGVLNNGDQLSYFGEEWKQIVDAHRLLNYDYAIFWSFV